MGEHILTLKNGGKVIGYPAEGPSGRYWQVIGENWRRFSVYEHEVAESYPLDARESAAVVPLRA